MRDDLRCIYLIAAKDMRTYYLKPPAVSWGMVFPVAWTLAFYLRSPSNFEDLVPGLIAMTILFSTTAAEAVVINFELRLGSLERLLLAPVSTDSVLLGKVLGGFLFGLLMTSMVTLGTALGLELHPNLSTLIPVGLISLMVFSSMGALFSVLFKEVFEAQTFLNLPRFLMVFLCGVVYPISAMPSWLQAISQLLPLTYTVEGLRAAFSASPPSSFKGLLILTVFLILFILPAMRMLRKRFE
ncbi:MAG: multidrug ABC transporter permease [Methanosaeta sp. SDB]|nr:MAG: multidrug ABC transporter permease [Methanosaeta sp. SDB]